MVKIILAEEQNIVRNGIKMLLETDQHISIVGEAGDGQEVLKSLRNGNIPDVILSDIRWEDHSFSLVSEVKAIAPQVSVVILTANENEGYLSRAFQEGASGFLLKTVQSDELIFSLKHVRNGGKYLCSELSQRMLQSQLGSLNYYPQNMRILDLTERELLVMQSIANGLTNAEISEELLMSKRTVEGYRQSLIEKSGVKNTASLIRFAVLNGLVH